MGNINKAYKSELKRKISSVCYPTTPWKSKEVTSLRFSDPVEILLRFITPMYRSEESA